MGMTDMQKLLNQSIQKAVSLQAEKVQQEQNKQIADMIARNNSE